MGIPPPGKFYPPPEKKSPNANNQKRNKPFSSSVVKGGAMGHLHSSEIVIHQIDQNFGFHLEKNLKFTGLLGQNATAYCYRSPHHCLFNLHLLHASKPVFLVSFFLILLYIISSKIKSVSCVTSRSLEVTFGPLDRKYSLLYFYTTQ